MKTNLFLITKYWRYHKKQFASMLTSIVILTAFLLIALLMERTECRRQYDDKLRGSSKTFYLYSNLGSDAYEEMSQDKRVSMIGLRLYVESWEMTKHSIHMVHILTIRQRSLSM